jgi:hypothetical protein
MNKKYLKGDDHISSAFVCQRSTSFLQKASLRREPNFGPFFYKWIYSVFWKWLFFLSKLQSVIVELKVQKNFWNERKYFFTTELCFNFLKTSLLNCYFLILLTKDKNFIIWEITKGFLWERILWRNLPCQITRIPLDPLPVSPPDGMYPATDQYGCGRPMKNI